MISFEERYYRPITSLSSSFSSSYSLINLNSITTYIPPSSSSSTSGPTPPSPLPSTNSLFPLQYLFIGYENKIIFNEIYENEICTREIILSLPDYYDIHGIWTITIHSKSFLYVLIRSRQFNQQLSCHLLGYEIILPSSSTSSGYPTSPSPSSYIPPSSTSSSTIPLPTLTPTNSTSIQSNQHFELKFLQDLKLSYLIVDLINFIYDKNFFVCCLGNDQKIHVYEVDCHGYLHRNSKRANKARNHLTSRGSKNLTTALPLHFALEDWCDGGSQYLMGYIDGHLYWNRHVEVPVSMESNQENLALDSSDSSKSPSVLSPTSSKSDSLDTSQPEIKPSTILIPSKSHSFEEGDHLLTIAEGSDEDEDSVDSTLQEYSNSSRTNQTPFKSPYTKNTSVDAIESINHPENIWDDMFESDNLDQIQTTYGSLLHDKIHDFYSKVFLHDPVRSIIPEETLPTSHTTTKQYTYSYLLNGSISCIQFYQREANIIRSFRSKYGLSSSNVQPISDQLPASLSKLEAQVSQSSSEQLFKWKDSFTGRTHNPSSCVLIGTSEGSLALLSLERKVIEDSFFDEEKGRTVSSSCWEDDDENPYIMRSIFISAPSPTWGSILCVRVTDVTGNGLNDVIVGYDTGLVRILSIVDHSPSDEYDQFSFPRNHSHSYDSDSLDTDGSKLHSLYGGHSTQSSHRSHRTLNTECWSLTHSSFQEICQLQLPFPVMSIEYGQLLSNASSNLESEHDSVRLGLMNHLVIVTTKSIHIYIPCKGKDSCKTKHQSKDVSGKNNLHDQATISSLMKENNESIEVIDEKKKLIIQLLHQLDQIGEIASQTDVC